MESRGLPIALILLAFIAWVYMRGWLRLRATSSTAVPVGRAGSFLLGLLLIWIAMASPVAVLDHELLTVHMIQHLLLMTLASPLIMLGAPVLTLLHGLPRQSVPAIAGSPLWRVVERFGRAITQPTVCWLAAAATLVMWHVPALFTLGLQSGTWHAVEQASFLGSGLLFWWPVVRPWPSDSRTAEWSIVLYLFLATLPCDILSAFLVFSERVAYPMYLSTSRHFGLSVLADQECAGALMWTCVTIVYLAAGTILSTQLLTVQSFPADRRVAMKSSSRPTLQGDPQAAEVV
jgi:putative membrane protein